MADSGYESVLCVKNEVFVYKIPPRPSNRGYRAAEWKLDSPDWTGRLRVVALNKDLFIKLENKEGELFAQCPVESYPSVAVESVMDSSRYFVIRIKDESGRSAFIGIGFADRSDSFDLNVTIQDHFKWLKQEQEAEQATRELKQAPALDLGFKAGQTITLNIGTKRSDGGSAKSRPKPRATTGGIGPLLPPPPGGSTSSGGVGGGGVRTSQAPNRVTPPPTNNAAAFSSTTPQPSSNSGGGGGFDAFGGSGGGFGGGGGGGGSANVDLLLGLDSNDWSSPSSASSAAAPPLAPMPTSSSSQDSGADLWGDFASAPTSSNTQAAAFDSSAGDWVQF